MNLHEVNAQLNSTTYKNRLSRIPRILDSGANIIEIHPEDSMTIMPTHKNTPSINGNWCHNGEHSGGKTNFPTQVKNPPTRNFSRTCSPVPGKTHNHGPGRLMLSWVCGSANRLKDLGVT